MELFGRILQKFLAGATIILLTFDTMSSAQNPERICDTCLKVNTTCYNLTFLFNLSAHFRSTVVVHKLAVLRRDNKLFFSFEPNITDPEYYKVGFVNLANATDNGVLASVSQIFNFGTFDIDQDNGVVYLGGSKGVYELNTNNNKLTPYSSRFDTIVAVFYKGRVYFVKEGSAQIVSKQADSFEPLLENEAAVKSFLITNDGVIVYMTTAGLKAARNKEHVVLSQNPFFRGLASDLDGVVYAWWVDGIYRVVLEENFKESKVVKVAHIPTIGAMAFDNTNNILFTSDQALYKLSPASFVKC